MNVLVFIMPLLPLLGGVLGYIILRDVSRSEQRGEPVSRLIRQLMFISFPNTDEKAQPYLGATVIGVFLAGIGSLTALSLIIQVIMWYLNIGNLP